jgi:hypothetical protein
MDKFLNSDCNHRHFVSYQRHHADLGFAAHNNYAHRIAGAIAFVVRNVTSPSTEYNFRVTDAISKACVELVEAFQTVKGQEAGDYYDGEDDEEKIQMEVSDENLDDEGEEQEREEERPVDDLTILDPPPQDDSAPVLLAYGSAELRKPPYFCPVIQPKLRALFIELYTQEPESSLQTQFFNVFLRYLVLSSIRPNGEWTTSSLITQRIAAILFTGRLTIALMMWERIQNNPQMKLHE